MNPVLRLSRNRHRPHHADRELQLVQIRAAVSRKSERAEQEPGIRAIRRRWICHGFVQRRKYGLSQCVARPYVALRPEEWQPVCRIDQPVGCILWRRRVSQLDAVGIIVIRLPEPVVLEENGECSPLGPGLVRSMRAGNAQHGDQCAESSGFHFHRTPNAALSGTRSACPLSDAAFSWLVSLAAPPWAPLSLNSLPYAV